MEHHIKIILSSSTNASKDRHVTWNFPDEKSAKTLFERLLEFRPDEERKVDYRERMDTFFQERSDQID